MKNSYWVLIWVGVLLLQNASADEGSSSQFPKAIPGLDQGQADGKTPGADWLLDARDDSERFRRLQIFAGGTYEQMWQIGYRYEQIHAAITDENWQLAAYHAGKLRDVFNIALMKRPNRTPNAENMFLDKAWGEFELALKTESAGDIQKQFLQQRSLCMACHVAEEKSFLNNTPIFRDTAEFGVAESVPTRTDTDKPGCQ